MLAPISKDRSLSRSHELEGGRYPAPASVEMKDFSMLHRVADDPKNCREDTDFPNDRLWYQCDPNGARMYGGYWIAASPSSYLAALRSWQQNSAFAYL